MILSYLRLRFQTWALLFLLAATRPTTAATLNWTNIAGGSWNTAANWFPNQVPGSGDDAFISSNGSYTITASGTATAGTVTMNAASGGQTLSLSSGTFTLNGAFNGNALSGFALNGGTAIWSGGSNATVGTLTINGGTLEGTTPVTVQNPGGFTWNNDVGVMEDVLYFNGGLVDNPDYLDGGQLINFGVLTWITFPYVENGAVISNAASGTINFYMNGTRPFDGNQGGTVALCNAGQFIAFGAPGISAATTDQFTNTGTFTVDGGTFNFSAPGSHNLTNGTLNFGITNLTPNGSIFLNGPANLAGALSATFHGGYVPSVSNSWQVLTYGSSSGSFTSTNLPPVAVWQVNQGTTSLSITVLKLVPQMTWPAPPSIVYGTALTAAQLDATANWNGSPVPGTFAYNPPLNTVLQSGSNQVLSVTFTPADATTYTNVGSSGKLESG